MKRGEAIAILRQILATRELQVNWVYLANSQSGECELGIKLESGNPACLEPIVENHHLSLRYDNEVIVVFRESKPILSSVR
jgi:hypothetical protein